MVQCAIKGCKSRSDVHSKLQNGVYFHRKCRGYFVEMMLAHLSRMSIERPATRSLIPAAMYEHRHDNKEYDRVVLDEAVPKDEFLRKKWIAVLKNTKIHDSTRICSMHFSRHLYHTPTTVGVQRLSRRAVPDKNLPDSEQCGTSTSSSDSDEDEVQTYTHTSQPFSSFKQNEVDTNVTPVNVSGTEVKSNIEVFHHKTKEANKPPYIPNMAIHHYTPLEKKLKKEVQRLELLCKRRLEKIISLQEINKGLVRKNELLSLALASGNPKLN